MSPFEPLQLPNGQVLVNRIAKAAMEENMADAQQAPSRELKQLYQAWADGEPGLLLTGNVMIDRRAMTGPGGVALEDERSLDSFREWAAVGRNNGGHFWVQLNHPGRQTPANLRQQALAPSAVALDLGIFSKMFRQAQGYVRRRDPERDHALCHQRAPGRESRVYRRADPRSAWLLAQPVSLALEQPAHRSLGRLAAEPRTLAD